MAKSTADTNSDHGHIDEHSDADVVNPATDGDDHHQSSEVGTSVGADGPSGGSTVDDITMPERVQMLDKKGAEEGPGELGDSDPAAYDGQKSSKGDTFCHTEHQLPPKETASGKWAKKRGRKSSVDAPTGEEETPVKETVIKGDAEKKSHLPQNELNAAARARAESFAGNFRLMGFKVKADYIVGLTASYKAYFIHLGKIPDTKMGWFGLQFNKMKFIAAVLYDEDNESRRITFKKKIVTAIYENGVKIGLIKPVNQRDDDKVST